MEAWNEVMLSYLRLVAEEVSVMGGRWHRQPTIIADPSLHNHHRQPSTLLRFRGKALKRVCLLLDARHGLKYIDKQFGGFGQKS